MNSIKISVSGRIVGQISIYAITDENKEHQPIIIHNGDTSAFKKNFTKKIPEECKYKTVVINHNWLGTPLHVGGQIDVYNGTDIQFEAPLSSISKKSGSSARLTYDGVTLSCKAGGWIRHTRNDEE
jgi:hypothetical protein